MAQNEARSKSKKLGIEDKIRHAIQRLCLTTAVVLCAVGLAGIVLTAHFARSGTDGWMIAIACVAAVMVAVTVLFLLAARRRSRQIAQPLCLPLEELSRAAQRIAQGDLRVSPDIHTGDEMEALAQSFARMQQTLREMNAGVQKLTDAAGQGNLDTRIDTQPFQGDFRSLVENVNHMLDAEKAPIDTLFAFIENLEAGVRQADMENVYQGVYARLVEDLNEVRHSLNVLLDEAQKLGEAGKDGDLAARGDISRLKGFYKDSIGSFNEAFDGLQHAMDDVIGRLDGIRDGRTDVSTDNPYQGYPGRLADSLTVMYRSLYSMVMESRKIGEAAVQGDLSVRGSLEQLSGGQIAVVKGFNDTLDSIVGPLDEIRSVLRTVAKNDFTQRLDVSRYQGAMRELAEDVSAVTDMLRGIEKTYAALAGGKLEGILKIVRERGRLSENDQLTVSGIQAFQTILDIIRETDKMAQAARDGDLSVRADPEPFQGAFRQIIEGLNDTMVAFSEPTNEVIQALRRFAGGDLTQPVSARFNGQYNEMIEAINDTMHALDGLLQNIASSAEQVAAGASQISDASQSLSQGSTEQASSVEELTASLGEVATQTSQNAQESAQASDLAAAEQEKVDQSNTKMQEMLTSMAAINTASGNIAKIIKVIDSIAFQTNILALNAAVEAARAGQYGKGFAVVAEEVRNLAAKSAEAAKNTGELIGNSVEKVQAGTDIANQTAQMLSQVSESVHRSSEMIHSIGSASNEQSTAIAQINQGITQVSQVVQTTSATAEECAASSEELSGQAEALMQLVRKFKLTKNQPA